MNGLLKSTVYDGIGQNPAPRLLRKIRCEQNSNAT